MHIKMLDDAYECIDRGEYVKFEKIIRKIAVESSHNLNKIIDTLIRGYASAVTDSPRNQSLETRYRAFMILLIGSVKGILSLNELLNIMSQFNLSDNTGPFYYVMSDAMTYIVFRLIDFKEVNNINIVNELLRFCTSQFLMDIITGALKIEQISIDLLGKPEYYDNL